MMSALHLLWIVPLSVLVGFWLAVLIVCENAAASDGG